MGTFNHQPQVITPPEWEEIAALPFVRDAWGLSEDEGGEELASQVYGVKFDFMSGSPGYVGDLFILQGEYTAGDPPLMLIRQDGKLTPAEAN
ncbi:MAG: hypothetical protein M3362_00600 [Acidobacteriota bacterium]|nr:hypothetical protein [Acidobacteriota bacterium]